MSGYGWSDDDDDGPMVFKRPNSQSKQGQPSLAAKNPDVRKVDGSSTRVPSSQSGKSSEHSGQKHKGTSTLRISSDKASVVGGNSQASVIQKSKQITQHTPAGSNVESKHANTTAPKAQPSNDSSTRVPASQSGKSSEHSGQKQKGTSTSRISSDKTSVISGNTQASVIQKPKQITHHLPVASNMESKHANTTASKAEPSDDSDDNKPLSQKLNGASVGIQKQSSNKNAVSYDSEDEKPLSHKFSSSASVERSGSSNIKKSVQSDKPSSSQIQKLNSNNNNDSDDSEDEKPLVFRVKSKAGGNASTKDSDSDDKPLISRVKPNGTVKREDTSGQKSVNPAIKRPLADASNSAGTISSKKAKISETSVKTEVNKVVKKEMKTDTSDHIPLAQRMKSASSNNKTTNKNNPVKNMTSSKKIKKSTKNTKFSKSSKAPPGSGGGQKWTTLEHCGVIFPPPYKPHGVKMLYNGQPVDLTPEQEEVATMFAVMKDTEYATKKQFIENFFGDWKKILGKNHVIKKFELCDFTPIYEWHLEEKEKKKQMTTEEKKTLKEEKLKQEEKYMWAIVDGVKEKVGNFRVEPPGLFRGRGEHPKMGKLKKRIKPRDITINIGKGAPIPECPIPGERWKEVRHDNTVTWLAYWNDPINPKEFKYVFLAASSSLKGQSDKEKYEKARKLKDYITNIRHNYERDFTSKDPTKRQIAVATYLIDKLALRAGNEKDDDEADTVGCCTLKVENVELVPPNKIKFDFLGKDSIRYLNTVEVDIRVYKAIGDFQTDPKKSNGRKTDGEDLFDTLDTSKLNAHLKELMPGLTAKVFRTYNASITLDGILNQETKDGNVTEKIAVYQHANKEVAIICNHQRSVSKSHESQMSKLNEKIDDLKAQREELNVDLARAKKGKPPLKDKDGKTKRNLAPDALEKKIAQIDAKVEKMELDKKLKDDLKTVALGTSKINYLDPRISVAWCKRHEVPIEKIFNKSLLAKFAWAMDVDPSFRF